MFRDLSLAGRSTHPSSGGELSTKLRIPFSALNCAPLGMLLLPRNTELAGLAALLQVLDNILVSEWKFHREVHPNGLHVFSSFFLAVGRLQEPSVLHCAGRFGETHGVRPHRPAPCVQSSSFLGREEVPPPCGQRLLSAVSSSGFVWFRVQTMRRPRLASIDSLPGWFHSCCLNNFSICARRSRTRGLQSPVRCVAS